MFLRTFIFSLAVIFVQSRKHLPPNFPRCYRDDPNLNKCLLEATELARPFLQKGIPEFNIAPLSPYYIPEVKLQQNTDSLEYQNSIKNLVITGLDSYKFTNFEFDPKLLKFKGAVNMGFMTLDSDFYFKGKILSFLLESKGRFSSNVTSATGTLEQNAKLITKKGITYLVTDMPVIKIKIGEVHSKMDDLFNGNKEVADLARNVIKKNIQELVEEITPAVQKIVEEILQDILLKSSAQVAYDEVFPKGFNAN